MQVLKPETKERILEISQKLFFENGYPETSTRKIADGAGISVSNLYKYFPDKQAIFKAVIEPFYRHTEKDLEDLFEAEHEKDNSESEGAFDTLMEMMFRDRYRFVILVNRSTGTEYEYVKGDIIDRITRHMQQSIVPGSLKDKYSLEIIASNFIEGILKVAERYHDDIPAIKNNIDTLVRYHMSGMSQFL